MQTRSSWLPSGGAPSFPFVSPLSSPLTFSASVAPLSACRLLLLHSLLSSSWKRDGERSRIQAEEDGRRGEARRGELRRGAPLTAPTAPGALSGGAGCNTTELRSPSLIYRHYVGQRWSIHLQLSSHKLKFMRAMVHSGERGSEPVCCDNLYLAKGSPLTLFYLLELKEMLWTEVDVEVSRSFWG